MTLQRQAYAIFKRATDVPQPELKDFLAQECAQNLELRRQVEELLAVEDVAADFLPEETSPSPMEVADRLASRNTQLGMSVGPYKLRKEIGEGGFGIVYMATQQTPMRRDVALKIIKPGMDSREVIVRFEAERQALAMMDHPNIARVFDAGQTENGRPYFVMELVKGIPITDFCDKNNLNTSERLKLFISVCHAVQHAHQKGVIHRDLKPTNILVTLDGDPAAKVINFGVAKAISHRLTEKTLFTHRGQMIGTPQYMSPEQAEMSGLDVDTRSDIYSLGVVLYELLTGTTPLDADRLRTAGHVEMQRIIQDEEPPKPSTKLNTLGKSLAVVCQRRRTDLRRLHQSIRGDLDWIVMKALEKRRDRRYGTAAQFAQDIQRHLNNESIIAGRPTTRYRFSKWVRRNKLVFAAGSAVITALVLGLAAATWGFFLAQHQSQLAQLSEQIARIRSEKLSRHIYVTHVGNADEAIRKKDYHRANVELNLCDQQLRGWEWSFLNRRLESIVPLQVPGLYWRQGVYSDDGKQLVLNNDSQAVVWDLTTGRSVGEYEIGNRDWSGANLLGQLLALLDSNDNLSVWNTQTKRKAWSIAQVCSMTMTVDNRLIALGADALRYFDATTGELMSSVPIEKKKWLQVSPDGRWIVASEESGLALIEPSTGTIAFQFPPDSRKLTFGPDGLAGTIHADEIQIWKWDGDAGKFEMTRSWKAPGNRANSTVGNLSFGANGEHLASSQSDGNLITIWDIATGREVARSGVVTGYTASMNPREYQVAHSIHNGLIRVWNYQPQHKDLKIIPIPNGLARFSPDGQWVAIAGDDDDQISIHDIASGERLNLIDGRFVDCGFPIVRDSAPWMPDSRSIVLYNKPEHRLEVWDIVKRQPMATSPSVFDGGQLWLYVCQDGRKVTTVERAFNGSDSSFERTWNVETGNVSESHKLPPFHHHTLWMNRLALSGSGSIQIWDTDRKSTILELPMPGRCMRFCSDGQRLFRGAFGGVLTLHDLDPTAPMYAEPKQFTGHGGAYDLHYLVLSPDETQLLASDDGAKYPGEDDKAILWDIESAEPLMTFEGQVEDWSTKGHIALSKANGVYIWTLPQWHRN